MTQRILVVDDAPDMRQLISQALEEHSFATLTAPDGNTALDLARHERPANCAANQVSQLLC